MPPYIAAVASSDATNIQTRISRENNEYVINGTKWWSSGAGDPRCKIYIVMGKTDPDNTSRHSQQSMILVPLDGKPGSQVALELALQIARREEARLHGLHVVSNARGQSSAAALAVRDRFDAACKGAGVSGSLAVEVGDGVRAAGLRGSAVHDEIVGGGRATNRAGGVEGGVTNGMPVIVRGHMKPIPTLIRPLKSTDLATGESGPTRYERSDVTSVPAASVVAEAMVAWVLAGALLERYGGDTFERLADAVAAEQS